MARILVIDDEPLMLAAVNRGLRRNGHSVTTARTANDGLAAAIAGSPDVIVLDLFLPDFSGLEYVRRLRTWSETPVVLLSGRSSLEAKVAALDVGADDFVDKPFSMDELRAQIDAVLRRTRPAEEANNSVYAGGIHVDVTSRTVTVDGGPVRLTPTEWRLLELLLSHAGKLVTYQQIIESVWGPSHGDEARNSLRVHLRQLRGKLGDDASDPRYIETEPHIGYRWIADARREPAAAPSTS